MPINIVSKTLEVRLTDFEGEMGEASYNKRLVIDGFVDNFKGRIEHDDFPLEPVGVYRWNVSSFASPYKADLKEVVEIGNKVKLGLQGIPYDSAVYLNGSRLNGTEFYFDREIYNNVLVLHTKLRLGDIIAINWNEVLVDLKVV